MTGHPSCSPSASPSTARQATFAIALLALGMGAAGFGYGAFGPARDAGLIDPPLWPPRWFFWAIWCVLYPTIGVAGAWLSIRRGTPEGRLAWRWWTVSVLIGLMWVPVVQASGSGLVMPVAMDFAGLASALVAYAAAWRADRAAMAWLTPSLAWGVATTLLKVWRLLLN